MTNRFLRVLMRVAMVAGLKAGVEWYARRSEEKARAAGKSNRMPKSVAREDAGRIRQTGRLLRRLLRF